MTVIDFTSAVTVSPTFNPSSLSASDVITENIVFPPPISTLTLKTNLISQFQLFFQESGL